MITQKQIKETIAKLKMYQCGRSNVEFAAEIKVPEAYLTDMYRHGILRDGKYQFEILSYINRRELQEQIKPKE
jgi:hypothetical protein